jgi:hypothetical protein
VRRKVKGVMIVLLAVVLVLGQIKVAPASGSVRAVSWSEFAAGAVASAGIITAVQYAAAACAAHCATVWSAVTLAAAQSAAVLGTALFYGSVVGLGAVAAYMLYKGYTWAGGQFLGPGAVTYVATNGGPSTVMCGTWPYHIIVKPCGFAKPDGSWYGFYTCGGNNILSGTCAANAGAWNNGQWEGAKKEFSTYGEMYVKPLGGYCANVTETTTAVPVSINDANATIQADLAGTNGAEAQSKALAALKQAIVEAIAKGFNDYKAGVAAPLGIPDNQWDKIAGILNGLGSSAQQDKVIEEQGARDNTDYVLNPATDAMTKTDHRDVVRDGVSDALSDYDMAAEVYDGVLAALQAYEADVEGTGDANATSPEPVDLTPPAAVDGIDAGNATSVTKSSISGALDAFWSVLAGLPVVSTIQSLGVVTGGSPSVTVTIPAIFAGGSAQELTLNFSSDSIIGVDYGTLLGYAGNIMLAITSVSWLAFLLM